MQHPQRQVVWSINHPHSVKQPQRISDCFSYIAQQWQFYTEHISLVAKKVLSKPWSNISKSSQRTKTNQVNIDLLILFDS